MSKVVRCAKCHKILARKFGEDYVSKHRGRTVIMRGPSIIVCELCGQKNTIGNAANWSIEDFANRYPVTAETLRDICQTTCEFISYTNLSSKDIAKYFFVDQAHTQPRLFKRKQNNEKKSS